MQTYEEDIDPYTNQSTKAQNADDDVSDVSVSPPRRDAATKTALAQVISGDAFIGHLQRTPVVLSSCPEPVHVI
jgi:hypothetical protein